MSVISLFIPAISAQAHSGWRVGVTASKSVTGDDTWTDEPDNWGIGASAAYKFNLPLRLYVQPEIALQYLHPEKEYWYGAVSPDNYNPKTIPRSKESSSDAFAAYASVVAGYDFGAGFSLFTGPEVRYSYQSNHQYNQLRNKWVAYWTFGLNKDFGPIYVNLRYSQHLNHTVYEYSGSWQHWRNDLRLGIGYCF